LTKEKAGQMSSLIEKKKNVKKSVKKFPQFFCARIWTKGEARQKVVSKNTLLFINV